MKTISILIAVLFISLSSQGQPNGQVIVNAKAYSNSFLVNNPPVYTRDNQGHIISIVFINHFDTLDHPLPLEVDRLDLTNQTVTSKILDFQPSNIYVLWTYAEDSLKNFWFGMNYGVRNLVEMNFSDSIWVRNWGNPFRDAGSLAYRITLGNDGNMYFGASSGDTYISYYDRSGDSIVKYLAIYPPNSYVMMLAGDTNYIYAVTGQSGYQLWALRKSDGVIHEFFSVPSNANIGLGNLREGGMANTTYFSGHNDAWWLRGFDTVRGVYGQGHRLEVIEFYPYKTGWNNPASWVTYYYDVSTSIYYFQSGTGSNTTLSGSIQLSTTINPSLIRLGWNDSDTSFNFIGDNYGSAYHYSLNNDSCTTLGTSGYNAYSVLKYSDSVSVIGGYPNGTMMIYNNTQNWSLQKYNPATGTAATLSKTTNPRKAVFFRTETPQGNHYIYKMQIDGHGNIVEAGDCIRTVNTSDCGVYNFSTDTATGQNVNIIPTLIHYRDLKKWNDSLFVFSTDNGFGNPHPQIYVYNSYQNKMIDSMSFMSGYNWIVGYGSIYIKGDTLYGIAASRMYKIYLPTKSLVYNLSFNSNASFQLTDTSIGVNASGNLPVDFGWALVKLNYTNYFKSSTDLFAVTGYSIIRWANYFVPPPKQFTKTKSTSHFIVYPNPANNYFKISKEGNYIIYSEIWKVIFNKHIQANEIVNLNTASGMYFIRDMQSGEVQKLLFIK